MNHCDEGGWVVDARPLSDDPADYDVARLPLIGCNHIRCTSCHALVRTIAGWRPRGMGPADLRAFSAEIPALYATADLTTSSRLEAAKRSRFYLCKCAKYYLNADQSYQLIEPASEWAISVANMWECDGHPLIDLPHTIDGVLVTTDQLGKLVGDALHGWLPPGAREADKPRAFWLARLHARLGPPFAEVVAAAVTANVTSSDLAVRERAQHFFELRPSAKTPR
jgi:hypothetical protein